MLSDLNIQFRVGQTHLRLSHAYSAKPNPETYQVINSLFFKKKMLPNKDTCTKSHLFLRVYQKLIRLLLPSIICKISAYNNVSLIHDVSICLHIS